MDSLNTLKLIALTTSVFSILACSPEKRSADLSGRENSAIIGGVLVDSRDTIAKSTVAIVASVITDDDKQGQFVCTGSLIRSDIVLTAAHCVPGSGSQYKKVSLFVVFNQNLHKIKASDVRPVIGQIIHPNYGSVGVQGEDAHDLALIKFKGPIGSGYQLAEFLNEEDVLKPGTIVTLAGYGLIETDGVNSKSDDRLRKVKIELMEDYGKHEIILDQSRGKGACHGDSGGPAFVEVNGTQYVWGVTSRGSGKDGRDDCSLLSVYTKIKSESSFIDTALEQLQAK